jgi:putative FmdB family regulatory protein
MPTYEFRCPQGHEFEKFYRTISGAEAQAACPLCGQAAERMMSATGFAFKGSGFYLTDYGKNAHRGTEPAPAAASGGDGAKGDAKSDTKGDAKSDTKGDTKSDAKSDNGSKPSTPAAASDGKAAAPKAAEAKPAAPPPKKSSGE